MQTISFDVIVAPCKDEEGSACRRAWVVANIDGKMLGGSGTPVSFHDLLAFRGLNTELELLTCSCGVAGCAGFHQDVHQLWTAEQVSWQLDGQEYARYFAAPGDADSAKEVVLTFATGQLSVALDALQARIAELLVEGPLHLVPGYDEEPLTSTDKLDADVAAQRTWRLNRLAREAREAEIFGPLTQQWIRAEFKNGSVREANVAHVLNALLREEAEALELEEPVAREYVEQQVLSQWLPRLWTSMEPLLEQVRAPAEDSVVRHFFHTVRKAQSAVTGELTLDALWSTASYSVTGARP